MVLGFDRVLLAAAVALLVCSCSCSGASRAAVVRAGLPGEDPALVDALTQQIIGAGYTTVKLNATELCDPAVLNAKDFDLLVLPNAADLPVKAVTSISEFAKAGGDIIALNAPLWQRVLINVDGKWTTHDDYQRANAGKLPAHVLFDFSNTNDWTRNANAMDSPSTYETTNGPGFLQRALHAVIPNLTGWDSFGVRNLQKPFPNGHTLTIFSAKGAENTNQLAVEWTEKDGSRWIAVVALYPEWRQYVLAPSDFHYWTSTEDRGGRGDSFKPENAVSLSFGLAFSHTGVDAGSHEFWVGPVGTTDKMADLGSFDGLRMPGPLDLPALDTLSPGYKLFDVHGPVRLSLRQDQAIVSAKSYEPVLASNLTLRSPQPRPGGGGFDKRRDWRFIPILEARSADGQWRGTPVTMMVNADGPYKGGVWASFGFTGSEIYKSPAMLSIVRQIAQRMHNGVFILDGGANFYTYFKDQPGKIGIRIVNVSKQEHYVHAMVGHREPNISTLLDSMSWEVAKLLPGEIRTVSSDVVNYASKDGYALEATIREGNEIIDRVAHKTYIWEPNKTKHFITVKDGEFMLDGKRWRANGVNYMPSSGIGTEDGEYFEHWIGARSYDPEVVDRDLDHIQEMGLNSVSAFVYTGYAKDQNMLDFLRRLDKRGMKANIGLRPGMPTTFDADAIKGAIELLRLPENDTVFAYDIAWEPMFGTNNERKVWDGDWENWIVERYGSVANAEKDWGFAVPRTEDGKVTNPLPPQIDTDGKWRVMTAAYRRFLDTLLYKKYGEARRQIRSVDPNHMVSFRMAEAGNPGYRWDGRIPYDWPYLAAAVDMIEPEAYGRIGDWERVKPGWFEFEYAKWAAPSKPVIWAEMGVSAWDTSRMQDSQQKLDYQAMFHKAFYRLLTSSGASGIFFWWYPGGFRAGENSDYGIINPDGTDKPVTKVIRESSKAFLDGPTRPKPNYWIEIDRDAHPDGIAGIYDAAKADFWSAIDKGLAPGFRTKGTGTDSSNCPLVAVGNGPLTGSNPPKYLDAAIDSVQVLDASGKWVEVAKGGSVKVAGGKAVAARVEFTNLGEARLLAPASTTAAGGVYLMIEQGSHTRAIALASDVPHQASSSVKPFELLPAGPELTEVVLTFEAKGRAKFGERFGFRIEP
jgi:hypothetical protein